MTAEELLYAFEQQSKCYIFNVSLWHTDAFIQSDLDRDFSSWFGLEYAYCMSQHTVCHHRQGIPLCWLKYSCYSFTEKKITSTRLFLSLFRHLWDDLLHSPSLKTLCETVSVFKATQADAGLVQWQDRQGNTAAFSYETMMHHRDVQIVLTRQIPSSQQSKAELLRDISHQRTSSSEDHDMFSPPSFHTIVSWSAVELINPASRKATTSIWLLFTFEY